MDLISKPCILIDMDGVVADLVEKWLRWVSVFYDVSASREDVTVYEFHKNEAFKGKLDPKKCYNCFSENGFFRDMHLLDKYAFSVIKKWYELGWDIYFVTSCAKGHDDKIAWIKDFFPFFGEDPHKHFIFAVDKFKVHGDVLIDDYPKNVILWQEKWPDGLSLCYDAPYNKDHAGPKATGWAEVEFKVHRFLLDRELSK